MPGQNRRALVDFRMADRQNLKEQISESLKIVEKNDMVGLLTIESELEDATLIEEIRKHLIRFALPYSAAYHVHLQTGQDGGASSISRKDCTHRRPSG